MKKRSANLMLLSIVSVAVLLTPNILANQTLGNDKKDSPSSVSAVLSVINVDGDVSLDETQNRIYWNPHAVGLTDASNWRVSFNNETQIFLKTTVSEAGHVATGAWWTTNFRSKTKIPHYSSKPIKLMASFRANVAKVHCETESEWLRIALACAIHRNDGSVIYTEIDFWDSPNTLRHPSGNTRFGGDTVYRGGDVVEYKVDQATVDEWTEYSLDLTKYIDMAWSLRSGDILESAYIVIETMGSAATIEVRIDDFWIMQTA
jgi:hypothetical protein